MKKYSLAFLSFLLAGVPVVWCDPQTAFISCFAAVWFSGAVIFN